MKKEHFINSVVADMSVRLERNQLEYLKAILNLNLQDIELEENKQLPSLETHNNQWILERWVIDMVAANKAQGTIKQYVRTTNNFFEFLGNKNFNDIIGEDITNYLAHKTVVDKISVNTKIALKRYITAFFKWGYKKGYLFSDITLSLDEIKPVQKKKDRITDEEIEQCRRAVCGNTQYRAFLELALSCGARVGEYVKLDIEDIDFNKNEISIFAEKTQTSRICFLSPAAKIALKDYIGDRTSGPLFLNTRRTRMKDKTYELMAKRIGELGNCHLTTTVHVYRKTYASVLYRKTNDILLVSKMLGHSNTDTTSKYYLVDDIEEMKYKIKKTL